ncbi:hypothetical protein OF829_13770 [Sphingomonas sp. LB-2]|uniref:surface-adhesin E family protein n=1 Tax=Sphingomonas caeni TaxID=2984949 RepID=UPI00222E5D55|nr:surface-adhesin E family protein [Sphingomonas caeni]MCW3848309.1 hypothetical protein [Sphingomonas caeni]
MPLTPVRFCARIAALALCLLIAGPALAQAGWKLVTSDSKGSYYIDQASTVIQGDMRNATSRTDYVGDGIQKGVVRRVYEENYDCRKRAVRLRKVTLYAADDSVLASFDWAEGEIDWIAAAPESLGGLKIAAVCG